MSGKRGGDGRCRTFRVLLPLPYLFPMLDTTARLLIRGILCAQKVPIILNSDSMNPRWI